MSAGKDQVGANAAATPAALVPVKRLQQRKPQPLGKKSGALSVQMRAIQECVLGQFGMLKGEHDEQAFLGCGCLKLIGSIVHIPRGRNQKEKARAILPA